MITFLLILTVPSSGSYTYLRYDEHTCPEEFLNKSSGKTVTPFITCGNILNTDYETTCEDSTSVDVSNCTNNPMKILLSDYPFYLNHRRFLFQKGHSGFLTHMRGVAIRGGWKPFSGGINCGRVLNTALRVPGVPMRDFISENISVFDDGIVFQFYTQFCFSEYRCRKNNLYPGDLQFTHIYHFENKTMKSSFDINLNETMEWPGKNSSEILKKFSQQYISAFEAVVSEYCSNYSSLINYEWFILERESGFSWTFTIDKTTGLILISALLALSLLVNVLCYCNPGLFHKKTQWISLKSEASS